MSLTFPKIFQMLNNVDWSAMTPDMAGELSKQIMQALCITPGVEPVLYERCAMMNTPGHTRTEDIYTLAQLLQGALCYAETALVQIQKGVTNLPPCYVHKDWPWERKDFKPGNDPLENLAKAGAFLVAETERLMRERHRAQMAAVEQGGGQ